MNFIRQRMKVRLATQLMSQSVADALRFCKDLGLEGFEDCDGTIQFITVFNNLFDIMNSRNMRAKGWKKALTTFNYEETVLFFHAADTNIKGLKFEDNTYVVDSNRATGFCGFLTCMKSTIQLYKTLMGAENSVLKYICSYKLSQDHIELFFGAIRSKCRFNNNPSARIFRAAYKRLLVHAQFKDGDGNCFPLESIKVLNYSLNFKKQINDTTGNSRLIENCDVLSDVELSGLDILDHDYIFSPSSMSEYSQHVVHYISGFVVKSLKGSLKCEKCIQSLENNHHGPNESRFSLISIKNRGGLQNPSADTTKTCKVAEKILREYTIRVGSKHIGQLRHNDDDA